MNKLIFFFTIVLFSRSFSQIQFAAKGHFLFPSDSPSWTNITNSANLAYQNAGKNNIGGNLGISIKINIGNTYFIMPELYYTTFKNEIIEPISNTKIIAKNNRADLPILVGVNVIKNFFGIYAGPVASYQLSTKNQFDDFLENAKNNFTVGYQFGAEVKISKIIISGRYEGAITKNQRNFINLINNQNIRYDNRQNILLLGLGYVL